MFRYLKFVGNGVGTIVSTLSRETYRQGAACVLPRLVTECLQNVSIVILAPTLLGQFLRGMSVLNFARDSYLFRIVLRDIFRRYFERFACAACLHKESNIPTLSSTHTIDAFAEGVAGGGANSMCEFVVKEVLPRYLRPEFGEHPAYPTIVQNALLLLSKIFGRLCLQLTMSQSVYSEDEAAVLKLYESS